MKKFEPVMTLESPLHSHQRKINEKDTEKSIVSDHDIRFREFAP